MSADPSIPIPAAMAVDKKAWLSKLHISNFHNTYYQYRDASNLPDVRSILIIGPGQGLEAAVFRFCGYQVTTYDIDAELKPDIVGSVHRLEAFKNRQFDLIIASHVLEHLSFSYFGAAISEIARVGKHALIYLPYAGRHMDFRYRGVREFALRINIPPFWRATSLEKPLYASGQHFWEVGLKGFGRKHIERRIGEHFDIIETYQNPDWLVSINFVLRSKN